MCAAIYIKNNMLTQGRVAPGVVLGCKVGWVGHGYMILMEELESDGSVSPPNAHEQWTFDRASLEAAAALPGMSVDQAERSIELVSKLHAQFLGRTEVQSDKLKTVTKGRENKGRCVNRP